MTNTVRTQDSSSSPLIDVVTGDVVRVGPNEVRSAKSCPVLY